MRVFPDDSDEELQNERQRVRQRAAALPTAAPGTARADHSSPPSPRSVALTLPALSYDALCDVMDDTYDEMRAFRLSGRAVSSGSPFMGWDDQRLVDGTSVKFQLRKCFEASTVCDLATKTWLWLSNPEHVLRKLNMLARLQTLQRVNDDLQIAVHDALTTDGDRVIRCVYVLCRMRTPRGFIICVRSFDPLMAMPSAHEPDEEGREVLFANVLGWFRFDTSRGCGSNSESSGGSSGSDGEVDRRRSMPGVRVEFTGTVDFGESAPLTTVATSSLWMALQWESLVVAPLFNVAS